MVSQLEEIDSLEVLVINDNELDPISRYPPDVTAIGNLLHIALASPEGPPQNRGECIKEVKMDQICCGSHGISLMITATKGDQKRTILFDTGPEESGWERNVSRLRADISQVEVIMLSHWHRDHSGGMLRAVEMINEGRKAVNKTSPVTVDLQPDRPDYRGFLGPTGIISLEADPTFNEVEKAGGVVVKNAQGHTVLDNMFYISGEIPRVTEYEIGLRRAMRFVNEQDKWIEDTLIKDERYLMVNLKERGLVVFTGCGHAGVVNTCKNGITNGNGVPIYAAMGGFHLADAEAPTIENSVRDLKDLGIKLLFPGHCSGWRAKYEIEKQMPGCLAPSTVGTKFTFV
ncbi:Metallo-hydrolase/oxidoreductase [Microthyrium microscopicum]|uniref:Metallo-hydrolase/oxidoreductase n=1 Tax=Microthyrium microscopicum TaxID=703497 RepID=A0A6A6U3V1_9PEZI|nr:Metallo-hydrolase/oxidoreductase [Microthyrium microscopicum]